VCLTPAIFIKIIMLRRTSSAIIFSSIYWQQIYPWAVPLSCSSVKLAKQLLHGHSYVFWSLSIFPMFMKHQLLRPDTIPNSMVSGTNYLFSRTWKYLESTACQHLPSSYCGKKDFYRIVNCKCVILLSTQLIPRDLENTEVFRIRVEIHN